MSLKGKFCYVSFSGLPFLCQFIVVVLACVGVDVVHKTNRFSLTVLRKICFVTAIVPSVVILCFISACGCDSTLVVILLCIAYGLQGIQAAATIPAILDMAPQLAGFLHGIADTVYSCMGFINPLIASAIISNDPYSIKSWTPLWYICSAVGASGIIIFVAFVKCEEQPWANIQYKDDYPETLTINSEVEDE